jgi:hypothetical protein
MSTGTADSPSTLGGEVAISYKDDGMFFISIIAVVVIVIDGQDLH